MIDLHTHTTASDGTYSFEQIVYEAKKVGLKALAITDHDNIRSALRIGEIKRNDKTGKNHVELIAGVELSVYDYEEKFVDVHMLGLFIDCNNNLLQNQLHLLENERILQKKQTVEKLQELGYRITFDEVLKMADGAAVGRPHLAKVLIAKYPNEFNSISDVFEKLLGRGKKAFIEREDGFTLKSAIQMVKNAGGLSFIAHPLLYPYQSKELFSKFKELGGDGVETYYDYVRNRPQIKIDEKENECIREKYSELAKEFDLLESGGSDFHGENKKNQKLGLFGAPDFLLEKMKERLRKKN